MRSLAILAVGMLAFSSPAHASITYVSQNRHIEVRDFSPTASADAPDFGLFDRSVTWVDPVEGHGGSASQRSTLDPNGVAMTASLLAMDGRSGFQATAISSLDVIFLLDGPTGADMHGQWFLGSGMSGLALSGVARLKRGEETVWTTSISESSPLIEPRLLGYAGELGPGTYRLEATASLRANLVPGFTSGTATFGMSFTIPSPATGAAGMLVSGLVATRRRRT